MTKGIEHIVAGFVTLKNREALVEIRDRRRRLLHENRLRSGSGLNLEPKKIEVARHIAKMAQSRLFSSLKMVRSFGRVKNKAAKRSMFA